MSQPIFEVWDGDKYYAIYANGYISGFGEDAKIANRIPFLAEQNFAHFSKSQAAFPLPMPSDCTTDGLSHDSAE